MRLSQNNIISIIAPNIKSGGGLELLIYLIEHIEKEYVHIQVLVYVDSTLQMIQSSTNVH